MGQVANLRGGWLPPPVRCESGSGPIDNRPQLAKLPHKVSLAGQGANQFFMKFRGPKAHPNRIVGRVGRHEWPDNHGLNHVRSVSQVPREACRFAGSNPIARLHSRIEQHALDLVKNESRQDQWVSAEDNVQKA